MIDKNHPYFVLVEAGEVEPVGDWFLFQANDGQSVQARKLLPQNATVLGCAGLNEKNQMEYESVICRKEVEEIAGRFVEACNGESNPQDYALFTAVSEANAIESKLRWYEVNPFDGSFVVHTLLVEFEDGEREVTTVNTVVWEAQS